MGEGKNLEKEINELLDAGKINPETAVKLLKQNSKTSGKETYSQPVNPPQVTSRAQEDKTFSKIYGFLILLTALGIGGYFACDYFTKRAETNQGQNQQAQPIIPMQQDSNPEPVQQVEQEQQREETVKRDTVGLNMWATSDKLNYSFKVSGKKVFSFCMYDLYARYNSNIKNLEWMRDEYDDVLLLELKVLGKNGETRVYPLGFSLQTSIDYTFSLLDESNNNAESKAIVEILKEKGYNIISTGISTDKYNEAKFYLPFLMQNKTSLKYDRRAVPAELLYLVDDEEQGTISIGKPED